MVDDGDGESKKKRSLIISHLSLSHVVERASKRYIYQ